MQNLFHLTVQEMKDCWYSAGSTSTDTWYSDAESKPDILIIILLLNRNWIFNISDGWTTGREWYLLNRNEPLGIVMYIDWQGNDGEYWLDVFSAAVALKSTSTIGTQSSVLSKLNLPHVLTPEKVANSTSKEPSWCILIRMPPMRVVLHGFKMVIRTRLGCTCRMMKLSRNVSSVVVFMLKEMFIACIMSVFTCDEEALQLGGTAKMSHIYWKGYNSCIFSEWIN